MKTSKIKQQTDSDLKVLRALASLDGQSFSQEDAEAFSKKRTAIMGQEGARNRRLALIGGVVGSIASVAIFAGLHELFQDSPDIASISTLQAIAIGAVLLAIGSSLGAFLVSRFWP